MKRLQNLLFSNYAQQVWAFLLALSVFLSILLCRRKDLVTYISLIGSVLGLLAYVIKISTDYSRLKTRFEENEKRDAEERKKNSEKFTELFNSRNKTNETLIELSTTMKIMVNNMNEQFKNLEQKIDKIKEN